MSTKQTEALKLALEALEVYATAYSDGNEAITAIRVALASKSEALAAVPEAHEQQSAERGEPVAWLIAYEVCCGRKNRGSSLKKFDEVWAKCSFVSEDKDAEINASKWRNRKETPLYTSPLASASQRSVKPWAGLTDVEWMNIVNKDHAWFGQRPEDVAHEVAKLVEAKLKEKNA